MILPASLALVLMALAEPCRAGSIIFNPGTGPIAGVTGFSYAPTSVLALGISSPGSPTTPNTTPFNVYYESVINGTQGAGSTVNSSTFSINGSASQFPVIAGFREHITSFSSTGTLGFALDSTDGFSTSTTSPNFFAIFTQPAGTVNPNTGTGAGFGSGVPILTGHFIPDNFGGSFDVNLATAPPGGTPANFNNSGLPSAVESGGTTKTLAGGGGTQLTVQVDTFNPAFFVTNPVQLLFSTTNSLPFSSVAPLSGFYSGPILAGAPNINYPANFNPGSINAGGGGNSLMFQSTATSGFTSVIPEPGSLVMAATAAMGIPAFLCFRRRFLKKSDA